jgi:hypothetical protein
VIGPFTTQDGYPAIPFFFCREKIVVRISYLLKKGKVELFFCGLDLLQADDIRPGMGQPVEESFPYSSPYPVDIVRSNFQIGIVFSKIGIPMIPEKPELPKDSDIVSTFGSF